MNEREIKRYVGKYTVLHFFTGAVQCTYMVFILLFLRSRGVNDFECGLVVALNALAGVGGRALFSYISDKTKNPKLIVLIVLVLQAVTVLPFGFDLNKYVLMGVSVVYHFAAASSPSLTEAWFFHNGEGISGRFSILYLANVIAVTIFASLNGFLVEWFGWNFLLGLTVFQLGLQFLVALSINDRPAPPKEEGADEEKVSFAVLFRHKRYVFVVLWLTITSVFTMVILSFLPIVVESVGGNTADFGFVRVVMYLLTIPLLLKGDFVLKKMSTTALFICACLLYAAAGLLHYFAGEIWQVALGAACQGTGGIVTHMTLKHYINRTMPHHVTMMAQSVSDAMYVGVGMVLAGLLGGVLTQGLGVGTAMLICSGLCIASALVFGAVALGMKRKGQPL